MTVYVDDFEGHFGRMIMCHMLSNNLEELHLFAKALGLKRSWFQDGSAPHYDLSKAKRSEAIKLGAVEVSISDKENWQRVYNLAKESRRISK